MEKRRAKKKVGRPTTGKRPVLAVRVHEHLYELLRERAAAKKLTISEAAAELLSNTLHDQELFPGIQQIMMLCAGTFWHAAKMEAVKEGLSHSYADHGTWLKDPDCYRAGVLAVIGTLYDSGPIGSKDEKQKTLTAILDSMQGKKS